MAGPSGSAFSLHTTICYENNLFRMWRQPFATKTPRCEWSLSVEFGSGWKVSTAGHVSLSPILRRQEIIDSCRAPFLLRPGVRGRGPGPGARGPGQGKGSGPGSGPEVRGTFCKRPSMCGDIKISWTLPGPKARGTLKAGGQGPGVGPGVRGPGPGLGNSWFHTRAGVRVPASGARARPCTPVHSLARFS